MSNHDKRKDRKTGNYTTYEELRDEVLRLDKLKTHSRAYMGKLVGVDAATVTRIVVENRIPEVTVNLKAMFNKLWIIPEKPDDETYCSGYFCHADCACNRAG